MFTIISNSNLGFLGAVKEEFGKLLKPFKKEVKMKPRTQNQHRQYGAKTSKNNQSEVIKIVERNRRKRCMLAFLVGWLVVLTIVIGIPTLVNSKVFTPPYNSCLCWGQRLGGADDERHSCNSYSGAIGAYAAGWVGGATAEAQQIVTFYTGTQKTLTVDAEILRTGGATTVGIGAFAGTEKTWRIDALENYYRQDVDPPWQYDDIITKIIDIVSLLTGIQCQSIQEAIEAISLISDFYSLNSALIDLLNANKAEILHIAFSFNAQPGDHTIWLGLRANAAACFTGSAFAVTAGQVTSVLVSGIDPPNKPTVSGPESGYTGTSYAFEAVTTDPNGDPVRYRFNWGDGNVSDWSNFVAIGNPVTMQYSYSQPGTYQIRVIAEDIDRMQSEPSSPHQVTISNPTPIADFDGYPRSGRKPLTVTFTDLSTNNPTSWQWDFGDGGTSSQQNPSHTYSAHGSYSISLTATNAYGSDTETKQGFIAVSRSAECPYVVVWDGEKFIRDNNILPQSEELVSDENVTDYYRLQVALKPKAAEYNVRIEEFENEHTYADQFELGIIDHSPDLKVGVTEDGQIFTYKDLLAPKEVTSSLGNDYNELLAKADGQSVLLHPNEVVTLNFGPIGAASGARLIVDMSNDGKGTVDGPDLAPRHGQGTRIKISGQVAFTKMAPGGESELSPKALIRPRENGTVAIADVSPPLPAEGQDFVMQLSFPASHKVDFIGLDLSKQSPVEMIRIPLTSATHSKRGDVTRELSKVDTDYAELVPGEYIDLAFKCPDPKDLSSSRDFVLISTGHYKTIEQPEVQQPDKDQTTEIVSYNYPNPFNPETEISYGLPNDSWVKLSIYNIRGQKVKTLIDGFEAAGHKTVIWDGKNEGDEQVASGVYFYRLDAGQFTATKKMVLLR